MSHIMPVIRPDILLSDTLMEAADMILLNKPHSLQNRISKSGLIQTVPIPKPRDVCKTIMVLPHTPMRHISSNPRFTGLTCTPQVYTT